MHDVIHLILDCCNNLRVSAAGIVYSDSCVKVKVWCAILIIQIHALSSLSDEIESIEVITNPGAAYDATVTSVVKIKTAKRQGDGDRSKVFTKP